MFWALGPGFLVPGLKGLRAQGPGPWVPGPRPKGPKALVHGSLVPGPKGPKGPCSGVSYLTFFDEILTCLVKFCDFWLPRLRFGFRDYS